MRKVIKIIVVAIILILGFLGIAQFMFLGKERDKKDLEYAQNINKKYQEEQEEKRGQGFYEKLKNKEEINILVLGDEVGAGSGLRNKKTWPVLLKNKLKEKYDTDIVVTNNSIKGTTSYSGFAKIKTMSDSTKYDLIISCYGSGEDEKEFSFFQECLIRGIMTRYENSSIIIVKEDLSKINSKIGETAEKLAKHYEIGLAGVEGKIENVENGQENYANAVFKSIIEEEKKKKESLYEDIKPIDEKTLEYTRCQYVGASEIATSEKTRFTARGNTKAVIAIDMDYQKGDGAKLFIDNKEIKIDLDGLAKSQDKKLIVPISETVNIKNDISILFEKEETAKRFNGFIINYIKK